MCKASVLPQVRLFEQRSKPVKQPDQDWLSKTASDTDRLFLLFVCSSLVELLVSSPSPRTVWLFSCCSSEFSHTDNMAEEAQIEVPVQAAEGQPVAEEHVAEEPAAEAAAEPAAEAVEQLADLAVEADLIDAGLKRSREEEQEGDVEEPDAKRAAGDTAVDVSTVTTAVEQYKMDTRPLFVLTGHRRC